MEVPQIVELQRELTSDHILEWLQEDFLQFKWWVLIFIYTICIIVWWKLLDKKRLGEMGLFTGLAIIIVLSLNEYGQEMILWDYPVDIIPVFPPMSSVNLLLLPILYSLTYQYCSTTKCYVLVALAVTAVFCFAIEPLLALGGFFEPLNWKYWLSFPLYMVTALILSALTRGTLKITHKYRLGKT